MGMSRVGSGSAASFLFVALVDLLGDGEGDPPVCVGVAQRGGRGLFDGDPGLVPAAWAGELGVEGFQGGHACLEAGVAGLGGGVHPHDAVTLG
jgi:hypothetical protein